MAKTTLSLEYGLCCCFCYCETTRFIGLSDYLQPSSFFPALLIAFFGKILDRQSEKGKRRERQIGLCFCWDCFSLKPYECPRGFRYAAATATTVVQARVGHKLRFFPKKQAGAAAHFFQRDRLNYDIKVYTTMKIMIHQRALFSFAKFLGSQKPILVDNRKQFSDRVQKTMHDLLIGISQNRFLLEQGHENVFSEVCRIFCVGRRPDRT